MTTVAKSTRDGLGASFAVAFDDPEDGGPLVALAKLSEPVEATFVDFPGYKPGDDVPVVDGTTPYTITQTPITGTGAAQTALAANPDRKAVVFWNAGAANDFRYNFFGTASGTTSPIYPPESGPLVLEGALCPKGALSVIGTSGQVLVIWEAV